MASSLLILIDDIAALLDDVAVLSKVAAKKTSGIMGDDLALNAEQVSGVRAERELPVIWAVAKGSFVNKLILVPAALAISAFLPATIHPLLMLGGLFLCFEGFEKVAHKFLHAREDEQQQRVAKVKAVADPKVDLVAFERDKVKGAVRTDFVLSAEIIVITLGTMTVAPIGQQIVALSVIAIMATVLVYGLVAGIVKLDDLGAKLHAQTGPGAAWQRGLGSGILRAAPYMMKTLSIVGTAAMFAVGGSILVHGVAPLEHALAGIHDRVGATNGFLGTVVGYTLEAITGVVAGGLLVGVFTVGKRLFGRGKPAAH